MYHTMGKAFKIMRKSIHAFLHDYHSFASAAALLVFPISASILLSQAVTPSSPVLQTIYFRLRSLFQAAGLPASSQFFSFLNLKLSQTIFSFFSTLPLTLTFLIVAKASVIQTINKIRHRRPATPLFSSLLQTHLFNSFIILSANAAVLSLLFLAFNIVDVLHLSSSNSILVLSAAGAVLYSLVLTNTMVVCNLAVIVSAMENCGGYLPFLKACVLVKGREATAIALVLPFNLGMAATEALFQYRVVRPYRRSPRMNPSVIWEAFSITYIYSLLIILDIIVGCMLFKSFKSRSCSSWENDQYGHQSELEPEDKGPLQA